LGKSLFAQECARTDPAALVRTFSECWKKYVLKKHAEKEIRRNSDKRVLVRSTMLEKTTSRLNTHGTYRAK